MFRSRLFRQVSRLPRVLYIDYRARAESWEYPQRPPNFRYRLFMIVPISPVFAARGNYKLLGC
jgi:hypothetical protein